MSEKIKEPQWIGWARRLQAISQTGLAYAQNKFDIERLEEIRAIAAEMIAAANGGGAPDEMMRLFQEQYGYATPKIDVRGVVIRNGEILLVKERADHRWSLPGGWADVGDTPSQSVEREIREEAGLEARAVKLLAVYDRRMHDNVPWLPFHLYKMFFLCESTVGQPVTGPETEDVGFFAPQAIPELSTGRVSQKQLHRMFEHYEHPDWPTDFD
jgi:ADP-ribose pyrophosphatase YjhB (NUDIX family)